MFKHLPLLLLIFLPLLVMHCGTSEVGKEADAKAEGRTIEKIKRTDEFGDLEIFSRRIGDQVKEGKYMKLSPDSILLEVAFYHNDTLDGQRLLFSERGDTLVVENYQMGAFEGIYKSYYENGQVELLGEYVKNTMKGIWKKYYESGLLMEEVTFSDNEENGPFTEYYENGALKAKGTYKDGDHEDGDLLLYDENGVLVRKMKCKTGMCKTIWKKE